MKSAWDLSHVRTHIRSLGTDMQWLLSTVDSVQQSLCIYEYHKGLARDAFEDFHIKNDPDGIKLFAGYMRMGADRALEEAKLASEANLIAIINITRNAFDIFAQIINALVLPNPWTVEQCDFNKVRKRLPSSPFKAELDRVESLHWFRYLAGFSNITKHRSLISQEPSQKFDEQTKAYLGGGAEVAQFEYMGMPYQSYWVSEVLEGTVEIHNEIVGLGIAFNRLCLPPATR